MTARKKIVLGVGLLVAAAVIAALTAIASAQQAGECTKAYVCVPSDIEGEVPERLKGKEVRQCQGTCKHAKDDPCAEGRESRTCTAHCDTDCCVCRARHCP